jgi:Flp pilus assembly protein TadG
MALVTPLLMVLMFGAAELGKYFLDEHVVSKAVRDGARYASRRSFSEYSCGGVSSDVIDKTRNLTRTGQVASGGFARLAYWTSATTITVSVTCNTTSPAHNNGIYKGLMTGVPVVTVAAAVPYASLFQNLGFGASAISLNSRSQAAVMGI